MKWKWTKIMYKLGLYTPSRPWGKPKSPGYIAPLSDIINPPIDIDHEEIEHYKEQERKGLLQQRNARLGTND